MHRSTLRRLAGAALVAIGLAGPAAAHPHAFYDGQAAFEFDAEGRVAGLWVAYVVDELNTLYTLQEMGLDLDGDGALTTDEQQTMAAAAAEGLSYWDYFADLRAGGERLTLDRPTTARATLSDGLLGVSLYLPLAEPHDPARGDLLLKLYDPTYYVEVTTPAEPKLVGPAPERCVVSFKKFDPSAEIVRLRQLLAELDQTETPVDENIGATFADQARLSCGA